MVNGFSRGYSAAMHLAPQPLRTFMVTCVCARRRRLFQVVDRAELLLNVLEGDRTKNRYLLHAFVAMPDHLHVLLTPAPDVSLEKAAQFIKGGFSFRLRSAEEVWERGRFDRRISDLRGFLACEAYIHANPVRARLVAAPEMFPFSSAARPGMVDARPAWMQAGAKAPSSGDR